MPSDTHDINAKLLKVTINTNYPKYNATGSQYSKFETYPFVGGECMLNFFTYFEK
jgi:hypothetical protein